MARPHRAAGAAAGNRWRRARPGERPQLYAAVDLGTNNCRLLIAERDRTGGLRVVDSHSQIVRLGEGLARSGELSGPAMGRAIDALQKCHDKVKKHQPVEARYIATQACRQATNGRAFLNEVKRRVGLQLETISPKDEAKFALLGSLDLVDPASDFALVIDIGGGSTELCWIDAKTAAARGVDGCAKRPPILGWASFPVGVVTLTEGFEDRDEGWYRRMVAHVRHLLLANDAAARFGPLFAAGRGQLIGNSGTVTSLAGVALRLPKYTRSAIDGVWLSHGAAQEARARLHDASPEQRAAEPCIGPQRAELVLAGCAILEAVWEIWPAPRLKVGDRGLREGILLSMMHGATTQKKKRRGGKTPSGEGARDAVAATAASTANLTERKGASS
jgi:exopolyphosphatase/guanosine-5'-triphosphate,3'-diphosphate pyrophosphatase